MPTPLPAARLCLVAVLLGSAAPTRADDGGLRLMSEPIGFTQVADAFEPGDLLDVEAYLGYRSTVVSGTVQRERVDITTGDGSDDRRYVAIAEHEQTRNELVLQLAVGVYHDLMVYGRLPIVLSDDRELRAIGGQSCPGAAGSAACDALSEPTADNMSEPLFELPSRAARRSGLPSVDLGIAWGVTNQYRERHLPTWVLIAEGSIATGQVIAACISDCEPGVSSGVSQLRFESRWSYRFRYFEPFLGIAYALPIVDGAHRLYWPVDNLPGAVDNEPPSQVEGVVGAAFIPWEDRGRFQRFELDVGGRALLTTAGRDASPLFDALGASDAQQLTAPNFDRVPPSAGRAVPFTGLTNVEAYGEFGLQLALVMQAARYVRFALGLGVGYVTPHMITGAEPCNTDVQAGPTDPRMGNCAAGIFNPLHIPAIDTPGRRFRIDGQVAWDFLGSATGMF